MVKKVADTSVHGGSGNYDKKKYTGELEAVKRLHICAIDHFKKTERTQATVGAYGPREKSQSPPRFKKSAEEQENDLPLSIRLHRRR